MVWGRRREEGSGWGTCVYLWQIHVDIWQNQYNIVKLKNKIKKSELVTIIPSLSSLWDECDFLLRCLAAFSGIDIRDLGLFVLACCVCVVLVV